MCQQISNIELFEIIKKQWADRKDISLLLGKCSDGKATEIKKAITEEILKKGKKIHHSNLLPMKNVISYLGIDENRIIKYAKAEAEIKQKATAATVTQKN